MFASKSLLSKTLVSTVLSLTAFVAVTAGFVYSNEETKALERNDAELRTVATALARAEVGVVLPKALTMASDTFEKRLESERPFPTLERGPYHRAVTEDPRGLKTIAAGETVLIRLMAKDGQAVVTTLDVPLSAGWMTAQLEGEAHRLYTIFLANGHYASVAEPLRLREAMAGEAALRAIVPLLCLFPVLILTIGGVLWSSMRSVKRLSQRVAGRKGEDLTPLSADDAPSELLPFIDSVNGLLRKVDEARLREIRFTADAAHELRSPLTSLTIEAEQLGKYPLPDEARGLLEHIRTGLARSVRQVSQLLHLARAQSGEDKESELRDSAPWRLSALAGDILVPLLPLIEEKSIDFSVTGLDDEDEKPVNNLVKSFIHAILRNLLENALRYTPQGGRVSLGVERTETLLTITVKDTGPGIPKEKREQVFEPFYRMTSKVGGTGLGLAIVKTYADKLGATIKLADAEVSDPKGLKVTVRVPLK